MTSHRKDDKTMTPDQTHPYFDPATDVIPGTAVAVQTLSPGDLEQLLAPHTIDLRTWAQALLSNAEFPEADAEQQTLGILASILTADTVEETLAVMDVQRARDLCGGEPGGRSPVLRITGVRPLKSDYAEGAACYVIVKAIILAEDRRIQFTTGAKSVQAALLKFAMMNWLPVDCALEIRRERTKAGYHPLNLVSGT